MKKIFLGFGAIIAIIVLIVAALSFSFGARWLGIQWNGYFSKMEQNVETEVFRETKAYNDGMAQQLSRHYSQWMRGDEAERTAIEATVRIQFSEYDINDIRNDELRTFVQNCFN